MDNIVIAIHFLFSELPRMRNVRLLDGHHRWAVWQMIAFETVHGLECVGWQFEPPLQELDLWLSLL